MPAKRPPKKPGRKSARELTEAARDKQLTEQMQRAGIAAFKQIERLCMADKEVPISVLGAARLVAEWHTDWLTVTSALDGE